MLSYEEMSDDRNGTHPKYFPATHSFLSNTEAQHTHLCPPGCVLRASHSIIPLVSWSYGYIIRHGSSAPRSHSDLVLCVKMFLAKSFSTISHCLLLSQDEGHANHIHQESRVSRTLLSLLYCHTTKAAPRVTFFTSAARCMYTKLLIKRKQSDRIASHHAVPQHALHNMPTYPAPQHYIPTRSCLRSLARSPHPYPHHVIPNASHTIPHRPMHNTAPPLTEHSTTLPDTLHNHCTRQFSALDS